MWRIVFLPFTWVFGSIVRVRNLWFNCGLLKSYHPSIKTIGVGNLCVGGSGKTPHIEYLIRLLSPQYTIATLSNGYGRKTKGFLLAQEHHSAEDLGDEPFQFYNKFPHILVCVDKNRQRALKRIREDHPEVDLVLLDDAFQHRWVRCGLNILLTDYYAPYFKDYLLPIGQLREHRKNARRADLIVVSKSPDIATQSPIARDLYVKDIGPLPHQALLFSGIRYEGIRLLDGSCLQIEKYTYYQFFLIAGIHNPYPIIDYLRQITKEVEVFKFRDHHDYKSHELKRIASEYHRSINRNKYIITTEKDFMRLKKSPHFHLIQDLNFCYLPIHVFFNKADQIRFENLIHTYVEQP